MAQVVASLTFEMELIHDSLADMERAFRNLAKCHGARFRAIERRIEALVEGDEPLGDIEMHSLDGFRFVAGPPTAIAAVLRECRALGVI